MSTSQKEFVIKVTRPDGAEQELPICGTYFIKQEMARLVDEVEIGTNIEIEVRDKVTDDETTKVIMTASGALGSCVFTPGKGWKFNAFVPGRHDSRQYWPTAEACIPKWARGLMSELLSREGYQEFLNRGPKIEG